jgi:hypothetical protein
VQIAGFVVFNAALLFYSIFQYFYMTALLDDPLLKPDVTDEGALNSIRPALYVIPIIIGVFEVLYVFFAYKLYQEFSWKIYKKIGPEPRMASGCLQMDSGKATCLLNGRFLFPDMYRWYESLMVFLKFDIFFGLAFVVQYVILQLLPNDPEFWATIFAMPLSLVVSLMGVYGIRREDRIITLAFLTGTLAAIAYFVFKMVMMFQPSPSYQYDYTWKYLTFFGGRRGGFVLFPVSS